MTRKKREAQTNITPALLKFREKRKWQIALRRYVLEGNISAAYAPYFGLDIANLRKWFEGQFKNDIGWEDFGKKWQFDHIIPVTYFDFDSEEDLKLCWNFSNLRVEHLETGKEKRGRPDVLIARKYFEQLNEATFFPVCLKMLKKIEHIEQDEALNTGIQQQFIKAQSVYLESIKDYSTVEFELLNRGRTLEEVNKEIGFFKKFTEPGTPS